MPTSSKLRASDVVPLTFTGKLLGASDCGQGANLEPTSAPAFNLALWPTSGGAVGTGTVTQWRLPQASVALEAGTRLAPPLPSVHRDKRGPPARSGNCRDGGASGPGSRPTHGRARATALKARPHRGLSGASQSPGRAAVCAVTSGGRRLSHGTGLRRRMRPQAEMPIELGCGPSPARLSESA
jgi:hypothetical protein